MPLITENSASTSPSESSTGSPLPRRPSTGHIRSQSQHSGIAKTLLMSKVSQDATTSSSAPFSSTDQGLAAPAVAPPDTKPVGDYVDTGSAGGSRLQPQPESRPVTQRRLGENGVGPALSDTPATSTAPSPRM
jgi:hypothetical protein